VVPTRKKQLPRTITPPSLCIDLSKVFCVGSMLPRKDTWNLGPHLEETVGTFIKERPRLHNFIYLSAELHVDGKTLVPVAVVIQCACVPTTFFALESLQSDRPGELLSFDSLDASWKEVHPNVSILHCQKVDIDYFVRDKLLLFSERPSEIDAEKPDEVDAVAICWNGRNVVWDCVGETCEECLETELSDDVDEDVKAHVTDLLYQERDRETASRKQTLADKKRLFRDKMQCEAMPAESLEERRVFKVYPKDSCLEPSMISFGDIQIKTGFQKSVSVNRFIGNAERCF